MLKYVVFLLIVSGVCSIPSAGLAQSIDDIYFATENYPPYNYQKNGELKGISIDLIEMIFNKLNSRQSRYTIHLLPWARGYFYLTDRKNTCLFSTLRTKKREKLFKWVGPITSSAISVMTEKKKNITINDINDIKNYKIGVVREDVGEQLLVTKGIPLKSLIRVTGVDAIHLLINKLNKGLIDVLAYDETVTRWTAKMNKYSPEDYEVVHTLKEGEYYFAFHIDTPDSTINMLQKALDELKKDGTFQKILDSYLK